ncbi:MAG: glycosyltransferase family 2 protein [Acidimicrobiales bacterium]
MPEAPVTVVLVHWNQPERCAASIEAFQRQGVPVRVLIVDNGSTPEARRRLAEIVDSSAADVELLARPQNLGFGPGANVGFRAWLAGGVGEWVGLAPHDALPADGTLAALIEAAEARPRAGLACADVGDGETPVFDAYFGGMTRPSQATGPGWESVDYPHGTLLIARRGLLDQVGLFDERYFAYCEETDLGLRAIAAGWEVGLVHGVMVHNPSMRSGKPVTDYLMHRNTLLLVRDHSGRYHAFIRFTLALIHLVRGIVQPSYRPWIFSARGRAWGLLDFLRGRYGRPPARLLADAAAHEDDHPDRPRP